MKSSIMDNQLSTIEILDILNDALKSLKIKFDINIDEIGENYDYNAVGITHAYIESDGEITICVSDDLYDKFYDETSWEDFIRVVKNILIHEFTHYNQLNKSDNNFKSVDISSNIKYLSNIHEIEAHANQAIEQFLQINYSKNDIKRLLKNPTIDNTPSPQESGAFWKYWDTFYGEYGDPVIWKKFLKYCYQYLDEINESKNLNQKIIKKFSI